MSQEFTVRSLEPDMLTDMYLSFIDSFSDYEVPFKLNKDQFVKKFVQRLKIDFSTSSGVWDHDQRMLAFIFTTIAPYKNLLSAYNGGTGVRPVARNRKLVAKMYDYLLPKFLERGVSQCVLEVLVNNNKAIRAYQSIGFQKTDLFRCYQLDGAPRKPFAKEDVIFKKTNRPQWETYHLFSDRTPSFLDARMNSLNKLHQEQVLEAHIDDECVGFTLYNPYFLRIHQIAVAPVYRRQGIAAALVNEIWNLEEKKAWTALNVSENAEDLNGFFERLGFVNQLNQYEMTLTL